MPIRDAGSGGSGSQDTPSGGYSADFLDYYSKIVGQNKDTGQWRRENNQLVDRKSRQQESGRVEMNDADKIARGAMQLSETIGSIGGLLNDENGNNWTQEKIKHGLSTGNFGEMGEGLLGFGMSLPFQMISAVPSGLASFYDAATGRKASSGDLESGTMESGELSGAQRLAAAGSGVIDTIGLGYGGSARMLGAMGKGVKAALGKEVTKEGAEGWIKKATGSSIGQFASDVGEEAGEEAAQSLLGDVWHDTMDETSLSRAGEAAAFGALGGGLMNVGGRAINASVNKAFGIEGDKTADEVAADSVPGSSSQDYLDSINPDHFNGRLTPEAQRAATEIIQDQKTPGVGSLMIREADPDQNMNQVKMGARDVEAIFYAPDQFDEEGTKISSADAIAKAFGTTKEDLDNVFRTAHVQNRSALPELQQRLQKVIQEQGRSKITLGRNPDTNDTGIYDVDLKDVFDGSGIKIHAATIPFVGADSDGDKMQAYFTSVGQSLGYVTQHFISALTGNSKLNTSYLALSSKAFDENKIAEWFANHSSLAKKGFRGKLQEALKNGNEDQRNALFAKTMQQIRDQLSTETDADGNKINADDAVAEMLQEVRNDDLIQQDMTHAITQSLKVVDDADIDATLGVMGVKDVVSNAEASGDTGGRHYIAQFLQSLGLIPSSYSRNGHPIFRQTAEIFYPHAKRMKTVNEATEAFENMYGAFINTDVFDRIITLSMKLRAEGTVPETSIEAAFNRYVTLALFKTGIIPPDGIRTAEQLKELKKQFREIYNEYVRIYNKALEETTTAYGDHLPFLAPKKVEMSDVSEAEFARAFGTVLGDVAQECVFHTEPHSMLYGRTINDNIEEIANSTIMTRDQYAQEDESIQRLWDSLVRDYGGRSRALDRSLQKTIESINIDTVVDRIENGRFDNRDVNEMMAVLNFYNLVLDGKVAVRLGLGSPDTILSTIWGKALFSKDADARKNALLSASLTYQFRNEVRLFKKWVAEGRQANAKELSQLKLEAVQKQGISPIHDLIITDLVNNNSTAMLDYMVNMDERFAYKEKMFDDQQADNPHSSVPLLVSALRTTDSVIDVATISERVRRGQTSLKSAERLNYDNQVRVVDYLESLDGRVPEDALYKAMYDSAITNVSKVNQEVITTLMYDALGVHHSETEKGTTIDSASMLFQSLALSIDGGLSGYVTSMFGRRTGSMTKSEWTSNRLEMMRCIFDPKYEMVVTDPSFDGHKTMTQKELFKEVGVELNGSRPTYKNIIALLRAYPSLASWIAPQSVTATISEGQVNARTANTQDLDKALMSQFGQNFNAEKRTLNHAKAVAERELLNTPSYYTQLAYSIEDADSIKTPEEMRRKVLRAHEQLVNAIVYDAYHPGEGDDWVARQEQFRSDTADRFIQSVNDAIDEAEVMRQTVINGKGVSVVATHSLLQDIASVSLLSSMRSFISRDVSAGQKDRAVSRLDAANSAIRQSLANASSVSNANAYAKEMEEHIRRVQAVLLIMNFQGNQLNNLQAKIPTETKQAIEEAIKMLPKRQQQKARDVYKRQTSLIQNVDISLVSNDVFMETEFVMGSLDLDALKEKAERIANKFGNKEDYDEKVFDDLAKITDVKAFKRAVDNIAIFYNNKVFAFELNHLMSGSGGLEIHANMLEAALETSQQYIDNVDAVREQISAVKGSMDISHMEPARPPMMYFENSTNAYMASAARMNAESGMVASMVGVDGSTMKSLAGIAFFGNRYQQDLGQTRTMSASEITRHAEDWKGYKYRDSRDGKIRTITDNAIEYWQKNPTASVEVYDPLDSINGLDERYNQAPKVWSNSNRYQTVGWIYAHLCDYAAEARILKYKKRAGALAKIVQPTEVNEDLRNKAIDSRGIMRNGDPRTNIWNFVRGQRKVIADYYASTFDDAGDTLGFGRAEAVTLAAFTTPAFRVDFSDGTSRMVSMEALQSDDHFNKAIPAEQVANIKSVSLRIFSPVEISDRVARTVGPYYYEHVGDDNISYDMQTQALNAMTNWDSYQVEGLSTDRILSDINPLSKDVAPHIPVAASRTRAQRFYDSVLPDQANPLEIEKVPATNPRVDKHTIEVAQGIKEKYYKNDTSASRNYLVVKSYIDEKSYVDKLGAGRGMFKDFAQLAGTPESNTVGDSCASICMSLRKSDVDKAVHWAATHDSYVMLHKNAEGVSELRDRGLMVDVQRVGGQTFFVFEPGGEAYRKAMAARVPSAPIKPLNPDDIFIAVQSDYHFNLTDAGHLMSPEMGKRTVPVGNTFELNSDDMFHGKNPITFAEQNDIDVIRQAIANNDMDTICLKGYAQGNISETKVMTEIETWLASNPMLDPKARELRLHDVRQGSCVGFVKQQNGGRTVYAPIILDMSLPTTMEDLTIDLRYGKFLHADWYTHARMDSAEAQKWGLYGEAYKSVGAVCPADLQQYWPALLQRMDGKPYNVDFVYDPTAESNRLFDKTDQLVTNNLVMWGQKAGYSIFHQVNRNGEWELKPQFAKMNHEILTDLLESGNSKAWRRVASGEITLTDSTDMTTPLNRIVRNVVVDCIAHNVPCNRVFSSFVFEEIDGKPGAYKAYTTNFNTNWMMAFQHVSRNDMLRLFHAFNPKFCPDGLKGHVEDDMMFDHFGQVMVQTEADRNGSPDTQYGRRVPARIGPHYMMGVSTFLERESSTGSYSMQHILKRGLQKGLYPQYLKDAVAGIGMHVDNWQRLMEKNEPKKHRSRMGERSLDGWSSPFDDNHAALYLNNGAERAYRKRVEAQSKTFDKELPIVDENGDLVNPAVDSDIIGSVETFRKTLGIDNLSYKMVNNMAKLQYSWTYNQGEGFMKMPKKDFLAALKIMGDNFKESGMLIKGKNKIGSRPAMPLLTRTMTDMLWSTERVKQQFGSKQEFVDAMRREMDETTATDVENIKDRKKRQALERMMDYMCLENGVKLLAGHVYGNTSYTDIVRQDRTILNILGNNDPLLTPDLVKNYDEKVARSKEVAENYNAIVRDRKQQRIATESARAGWVTRWDGSNYNTVVNLLRSMSNVSKTMAMANPFIMAGNVIDRAAAQGGKNLALKLGHIGIGPYAGAWIDQDVVRAAAKDEMVIKLYASYRTAVFTGDEKEMLANCKSIEQLDAYLEQRARKYGKLEQFQNAVVDLASGKNFLLSGQIRNFINIFVKRAGEHGHDWHFADAGGRTLIEEKLADNPGNWLLEMLSSENNADFVLALSSMNEARKGDMAQRNIVSAIYSELAARSSAFEFLTTTTVSRFVQYQTNKLGRIAQWVAPISSLHYMAVETASKMASMPDGQRGRMGDFFKSMGIDETMQMNSNLKEAIYTDVCHIGLGMLAALLAGLAAFEPPEDEDKWGVPGEWTLFGQRLDENWWIEDVLGLAIPLSIFWKSVMIGKPRMDVLINGASSILAGNPLLKVGEVIDIMLDPEEGFAEDYNMDALDYEDAKGGPPSPTDYYLANGHALGLSWVSQFITPSVLKMIYTSMDDSERSYKRVYETNEVGLLTDDGQAGKTVKTDYADALLRKISRNNPVIGWYLDLTRPHTTGYLRSEMPKTVYYDPDQLNSYIYFSTMNEDGTAKSEQECQALALEAMTILESKTPAELRKEGFVLPSNMTKYVSKIIWQCYDNTKQRYLQMQADGALEYTTLGDGDWTEGQKRAAEIKQAYNDELKRWSSLYYDKLYSKEMRQGLAQYNRINTTYAQDANGDWYATGYAKTWLPFIPASGEVTRSDGYQPTMSRENDWATMSVVTGNSTGMRGLIPVDQQIDEIPDLDSWGDDGNGSGSGAYPTKTTDDSKKYPYSYGRRSGGGGGGGGGSYSPNIYSRLPSGNMNNARTMNAQRLYDAQFDYLRPNWETKGSRESYKRSDI